jgi:hypothetical protein
LAFARFGPTLYELTRNRGRARANNADQASSASGCVYDSTYMPTGDECERPGGESCEIGS